MIENFSKQMIGFLLLMMALAVSACNAEGFPMAAVDTEKMIAESVEATLTAIPAEDTPPSATPVPSAPESEPALRLPAPLPNWEMVEKPSAQKGSDTAPVTIIEYSDFQCPWCGRFSTDVLPNLQPLINDGLVRFVYKQFPVLGEASVVTAQVTECAGEQGDFWTLHDWLFDNQSSWKSSGGDLMQTLLDESAKLGYDREALALCSEADGTQQAISADYQESQRYGFRGTPSFMVNGRPLYGFTPWEQFQLLVEASLAEAAGDELPDNVVAEPTPNFNFGEEAYSVAGDPDAPVVIYEYSDYQCPFCQRFFADTKPALDEAYVATGKVYFIYKDFPIDNIHAQARKAAESAECAGEQDAYWPMHDRIYAGKSEWEEQPDAVDIFKAYATELELDQDGFDSCLDSDRYADEVQVDLEEGQQAGVTGTPSFFINGQMLVGAQPFAKFEEMIEAALEEATQE